MMRDQSPINSTIHTEVRIECFLVQEAATLLQLASILSAVYESVCSQSNLDTLSLCREIQDLLPRGDLLQQRRR